MGMLILGVIFMSFGSVMKDSKMSAEKKQSLMNMFKKFSDYDFIWKWTEELPDLPKNVLVSSWLPQADILAHPNLKLFISHVGMGSFQETICYKKPVVAIPVTADQPLNGIEVKRLGIGEYIMFDNLNEKDLFDAVDSVLHDPKYTKAAQGNFFPVQHVQNLK